MTIKESRIVEEVVEYLDRKTALVFTELPVLQRRVDVVSYDPDLDLIIAVEAKVENWKRALRQALSCLLFADQVFLAVPEIYSHRVDRTAIGHYGIGLIEVNSRARTIVRPRSSPYVTNYYRKWVINRMSFENDPADGVRE